MNSDQTPVLPLREPAYAAMESCLRAQAEAKPLTRFARFLGRNPLHPSARAWFDGATGEIEVARILETFDSKWSVLHAVSVADEISDMDHVLIGPPGVFAITSKHHENGHLWVGGGGMMVNGYKTNNLGNARLEAERAARYLTESSGQQIPVTPLIVVVGAKLITRGKAAPTVDVVESSELKRWLHDQPDVIPDHHVRYLALVGEERANWHRPEDTDDLRRHLQRFERLQKDVAFAKRRARWMRVWGASSLAIIGLAAVTLIVAILTSHH